MTAQATTEAPRLRELDALRGIAAVAVMVHHYLSGFADRVGSPGMPAWRFDGGRYGVHLFFIISGFVIVMTLARTRSVLDFAIARGARLYPAYWLAVCATGLALLWWPLPNAAPTPSQILVNLTMVQRYLGVPDVDGVYWTLGIELLFYALAAVWWKLGWLRRPLPLLLAWLAASVGLQVARDAGSSAAGALLPIVLWGYANLFIAGIAFHRWVAGERGWRWPVVIVLCVVAQAVRGWEATAIVAGFAGVVALAVSGHLRWLGVRPLVWLGTISYPLYLLHQDLGYLVLRWAYDRGLPALPVLLVTGAMAVGAAAAVTYGVERPCLAWIKRVRAARKAGATVVGAFFGRPALTER